MKLNEILPWNWGKKKEEDLPGLLDTMWRNPMHSLRELSVLADTPKVDLKESDKEIRIRVEAPGLDEKDLSVDQYNGSLRIRGTKKEEKREKRDGYHYSECQYGSFSRMIPLPKNVKWDDAKAKYKKGVLNITLPKTKTNTKSIEIKVN